MSFDLSSRYFERFKKFILVCFVPFNLFVLLFVLLKTDFLVKAFWGRSNSEEGRDPFQHSEVRKELASETALSPPKLPPTSSAQILPF